MTAALLFLAGPRAAAILRRDGLRADAVRVVAGASGGPKWFVLSHLDRAVFPWISDRSSGAGPLFLVGSSAGAWRMAALARADPLAAVMRFEEAYLAYRWSPGDSPQKVTDDSQRVLDRVLEDGGVAEILSHPMMRLNVLAVRGRGPAGSERRAVLGPALVLAAAANAVARPALGAFFERALFADPRDRAPFAGMKGFGLRQTALCAENLRAALMASGAIPHAMAGLRDISGARPGVYRDGGVIDYHLDIPFLGEDQEESRNELILYPHFSPRIIPGWFDKYVKWRRPDPAHFNNVLLICPSPDFVSRLPHGKIPDRRDFAVLDDRARLAYWRRAIADSEALADAFRETVARGDIGERLRPLMP